MLVWRISTKFRVAVEFEGIIGKTDLMRRFEKDLNVQQQTFWANGEVWMT